MLKLPHPINLSARWSRVQVLFVGIFLIASCGSKDSKDSNDNMPTPTTDPTQQKSGSPTSQPGTISLVLTADGMNSVLEGAALRLAGVEDENYAYPGIGMNYGESIVEGLRIKLLGVGLQTVNEETGGFGPIAELINFGPEGKVLEISEGFNGKIEVAKEVAIPAGKYTQVNVNVESAFSLKAYAYLDQDNDGVIDTTIWTTPAEIKMQSQKLAPGAMPGYGWYRYPWLVATMAKSVTDNSNSPTGHVTVLPEPIVVTEQGVVIGGKAQKDLALSLLVDTFRIVKVWDGRYGAGSMDSWTPGSNDPNTIPSPVFPFPQGPDDSRILQGSIKTYDLYPPQKPAFAMGNYLSIYGFVNKTGIKAQNFVISKTSTITPYNSQFMTLILDGSGVPLFGKTSIGESNNTLHIGPMARKFEQVSDGSYTFGTAGSEVDENGKWDGGLSYSEDVKRAGHLFSGFRKLSVGQRSQMIMKNGLRCKGEYDYCVDEVGVAAYYLRAQ